MAPRLVGGDAVWLIDKVQTGFRQLNPIPHGMGRAHNFMGGGGHIDPTTLKALWGPMYVP